MMPRSLDWPQAIRRYLMASLIGHLVWEVAQLPLYTIWQTGTRAEIAFAILHCTVGDVMIAGLSLLVAVALWGSADWPHEGARPIWFILVVLGIGYTIYSEWLNVSVRRSWAYSDWMPTLPFLGTGLGPLLQWLVVPTFVSYVVARTPPWTRPAGK
jgi:hypothetical protein